MKHIIAKGVVTLFIPAIFVVVLTNVLISASIEIAIELYRTWRKL